MRIDIALVAMDYINLPGHGYHDKTMIYMVFLDLVQVFGYFFERTSVIQFICYKPFII
jgi:hypothetical protein